VWSLGLPEFRDDDEEVVQPEPRGAVFAVDPAPGSGSHVEVSRMQCHADDGAHVDEGPEQREAGQEGSVAEPEVVDDVQERVDGDGEGEDSRGEIAGADEPALGPAGWGGSVEHVAAQPLCVEEEGDGLLDVGEDEVEEEDGELGEGVSVRLVWWVASALDNERG